MNAGIGWLALVAGLATLVILWVRRGRQSGLPVEDGASMPDGWRRVLVFYLLGCGALIIVGLVLLVSLDFPEAGVEIKPASNIVDDSGEAPQVDSNAARLLAVVPQSTVGGRPTEFLMLVGHNLPKDAKVRFNREVRLTSAIVPGAILQAQLQAADLRVSQLMVDVVDGDRISNAVAVQISNPRVPLDLGLKTFFITRDVQLILLALCAGALGSFLHAGKSLTDFIGNRTLTASWFWWYVTRPMLGMAMAVVFYALLRAGFLAGTAADARIVNPFGVIAIAALVGMFADKAASKLADIFDTLLTAKDERADKLSAPVIDRLDPDTVAVNSASAALRLVGDRLAKVTKVRIGASEQSPDSVSAKEVKVTCRGPELTKVQNIGVTAITDDGASTASVILHITDLAIVPSKLQQGQVGTNYADTFTAKGGKAPLTWSLKDQPTWLSIAATTGALSGTPAVAGAIDFSVIVRDANEATQTANAQVVVV